MSSKSYNSLDEKVPHQNCMIAFELVSFEIEAPTTTVRMK